MKPQTKETLGTVALAIFVVALIIFLVWLYTTTWAECTAEGFSNLYCFVQLG